MGGNVRHAYKGSDREMIPDARKERDEASGDGYDELDADKDNDRYGQRDHELYCPYCGERGLAAGDNYCLNCGAELRGTFE